MRKRLTICSTLATLAIVGMAHPAGAEWDWYAGDITRYTARNTATVIPEQVQTGIDAGLDWLVLSGPVPEGIFIGLWDVFQEYELNAPRITPILGAEAVFSDPPESALLLFGVDPRAPVPKDSLQQIIAWVESQNGVSLFTHADLPANLPASRWQIGTAFQGIYNGKWNPECEPGAGWDRLLASGHRMVLVGGGDRGGGAQKTYVWAENNQPDGIIAGIRRGGVYVAQADGIQMDLRVNSRPMGSTVSIMRDAYVRLRATARHPISRVLLIADGEVVWTAYPDTSVWEERFFLPLTNRTYLRAILESDAGRCRTMGNPVFLISETDETEGEIPLGEPDRLISEPIDMGVDVVLEAVANLDSESQRRVLSEFLRDVRMRYYAVRVLEIREDLIPDRILWELVRHPDREVRLGAAYALVVRAPVELPDLLAQLLKNTDLRVREYAARMLFQYTEGTADGLLVDLPDDPAPSVQMYLIRAFSPALYDPDLTRYLIAASRSPHPGVAAAAVDKLVETGTRNYRVIRALLDSARAGNPYVIEPIVWIGDRRSIPDLEAIFQQEDHGPLKRASFLALEKMGAPYIGRKEVVCAWMPAPPRIDGRLDLEEWEAATPIREFAEDDDGAPPDRALTARVAYDSTRFYLSLVCEAPDTLPPAVQVRLRDDAEIQSDDRIEWAFSAQPGVPYVFAVTPLGVIQEHKGGDPTWSPAWSASLIREPNRWTVECAIPLSSLGFEIGGPISPLRFNVALVSGRPPSRRWTWSVTYNSPHNPDRFGDMSFETAPSNQGNTNHE